VAGEERQGTGLMQRFEDIRAWQEARKLTKQIYELTATDPFAQDRCLRDQLVRAAISSMTQIAEGSCANSEREFARLLQAAQRSLARLQSLLYTALDLGYFGPDALRKQYEQAARTSAFTGDMLSHLEHDTRIGTTAED
jgi:four helix bundle protein